MQVDTTSQRMNQAWPTWHLKIQEHISGWYSLIKTYIYIHLLVGGLEQLLAQTPASSR